MIITYIENGTSVMIHLIEKSQMSLKAIYENIMIIILQFEKLGMCDIDENLRCEKKELDEAYKLIPHTSTYHTSIS